MPNFLRKYWLEIIASFPVFIVVRYLEWVGFAQRASEGQEIARTLRQIKAAARSSRLLRFLVSIQNFKLYGRVKKFWQKPDMRHHMRKNKRK